MKKKFISTAFALSLLSVVCASLAMNASDAAFTYLSDSDAARLEGGGCVSIPDGNKSCDANLKGCKLTYGEKDPSTSSGSWQADTPKNCGVKECGTVPQSKACGS